MANSEGVYFKGLSDGDESQRSNSSRLYKVGIALLGVSCLLLLSGIAISTGAKLYQYNTSAAESTNLAALPALRAMKPIPMAANLAKLRSIPGPSPFKELALAGIEAGNLNSCQRDVSANANNPVKAVYATMSAEMQAKADSATQAIVSKATDLTAGGGPLSGPMGPVWDPLAFSAKASGEKLLYFREAEIKHGRICMLATVGFLMGEVYEPVLPGTVTSNMPINQVFYDTSLYQFWLGLFALLAIPEFTKSVPTLKGFGEMKQGRIPGDFGWDPLQLKEGLADTWPSGFVDMQNKEINNGRLAMLGAVGMFVQQLVTGGTEFDRITAGYHSSVGLH